MPAAQVLLMWENVLINRRPLYDQLVLRVHRPLSIFRKIIQPLKVQAQFNAILVLLFYLPVIVIQYLDANAYITVRIEGNPVPTFRCYKVISKLTALLSW